MERWPQQVIALAETTLAIERGVKRICVTSPTGTGKTGMMIDTLKLANERRWPACLYTNRTMLFDQTKSVLESNGIFPGLRAAGHPTAHLRDIQLCMTQTEASKSKSDEHELHKSRIILVDEIHNQTGPSMRAILNRHIEQGAVVVGYTATPLDIGDLEIEQLIVACTTSQGRECGALLPAHTYGPDEPSLKHIKNYRVGEDLTEGDNVKSIMRPGVFGRVYDNWKIYNPDARPTILFGPGVKESIWFAEQFHAKGVRAAHIDGDNIWVEGEFYNADAKAKEEIIRQVRCGEIQVICNRFVLREGIDIPELFHAIFATVFGSLSSYLQAGGRLLRFHPSLEHVIAQDHGGNWWRHGSLNEDRIWKLGDTNRQIVTERAERMRQKEEREPIVCPECSKVRQSGKQCPACGHVAHVKSRMVVQVDGTLKEMKGDICKPRKVSMLSDTEKKWSEVFWRAKHSKKGMTFTQAEGLFFREHGYWPPRDLPYMPLHASDWARKVANVANADIRWPEKTQEAADPQKRFA